MFILRLIGGDFKRFPALNIRTTLSIKPRCARFGRFWFQIEVDVWGIEEDFFAAVFAKMFDSITLRIQTIEGWWQFAQFAVFCLSVFHLKIVGKRVDELGAYELSSTEHKANPLNLEIYDNCLTPTTPHRVSYDFLQTANTQPNWCSMSLSDSTITSPPLSLSRLQVYRCSTATTTDWPCFTYPLIN